MTAMHIRPAAESDLDAIRAIYNYYVEHSTCTYQMELETAEERLAWFRNRNHGLHPVIVAEIDGRVIGWAALSQWNSRCGYVRTVEASVYVHHDYHRHGVGRALLGDLIERARSSNVHTIIGGASTDQAASLALQLTLGFSVIGTFREVGYKFNRWLDVTYTQLMLKVSD